MTGYLNLGLPRLNYGSTTEDEEESILPGPSNSKSSMMMRKRLSEKTGEGAAPGMVSKSISMADLAAAELVEVREIAEEVQAMGPGSKK